MILISVIGILVSVMVTLGRTEQPVRSGTEPTGSAANQPVVRVPTVAVTQPPDLIALLIDRVSSSEAPTDVPVEAAAESPPPTAADDGQAGTSLAATPRHDLARAAPLAVVGVWGPASGSCSAGNAREGLLRAVISEHGARAGETSCVFKKQTKTERDWRVVAACANGHERWTSNVRLTIKRDRLIWASERGRQAYVRCRSNA